MKRSHYIIGGLALAISMPSCLQAQTTQPKDTTMTRTVVVEQEYNPDIMDASKVNVLPKVEEPTVSKKEVEYATTFFPATSVPAGLMRPYTGKEVQPGTTPGYVRAGYGNYGNLDILANYLFRLSQKDKLNVRFQMDGMDGKLTLPFTDGEKWNESTMFGEGVELLLATLTNNDVSRICYIKKGADNQRYFYYQTNDVPKETLDNAENGGKVPSKFPTKNISYTVYKSSTNINSVLLVGDTETATLADDSKLETTIVWAYDGNKWVEFSTTSSVAYCPKYTQPSIIYYNDLVYIFGQDFSSIYVSNQGLFWKKANPKFSFPHRDWSKGGTPDPDVDPEFRGKTNYSMVLDPDTQNLWIIFSKGSASFEEEVEKEESTKATTTEPRTYEHDSEVWRGRLNQLWFDLANAKK